jgi:hypothetical protein
LTATLTSLASTNTLVVTDSGNAEVGRINNAVSGTPYDFSLGAGSYTVTVTTDSPSSSPTCQEISRGETLEEIRCVTLPPIGCQPNFLGECDLKTRCCNPEYQCKRHVTGTCNDTLVTAYLCIIVPVESE